MSYYNIYLKYKDFDFEKIFHNISPQEVETAIETERQSESQFLALLSPAAENYLEDMAQKAHGLTLRHFGRTIQLYTPMYLSNYCENQCAYCGFNSRNDVARKKLSLEEVEKEAIFISSTGLRHILILTGESLEKSPLEYIKDCVRVLKKYFSSISIEIYALTESEYAQIAAEGVDGLTLYQETYDEVIYDMVHKRGPKKDYLFRLDAPERAAKNSIRNVNIGVLLGLNDWRREIFFMGLHAKYLQDKFYDVEIGASIPRIKPHLGDFKISSDISDKNITQIVTALRIFLPRLGITISTRESPELRENLLPLGITRMSAGSSTKVGGHTIEFHEGLNPSQFEISDTRNVEEIKAMLAAKGYQPVLKDWMQL
ncbi:MAG: thiamine biosynthesis protein ThiH [Omnitrophica bacterium GWA2_41_15]|nr:MAG: thiamine biosynthesis protein ThiH [Omnitrophica bacterium GWA2_41_15]HAZ09512.1 2-iminoacetate synthase ThiH [Candidatus Omnitrophota bacterium]